MRGVAGKQHPSLAVGGRLVGAIRPCRSKLESRQGNVGAGDMTQYRLNMLQRDRLASVKSPRVEIDHRDRPGL